MWIEIEKKEKFKKLYISFFQNNNNKKNGEINKFKEFIVFFSSNLQIFK